ncbi:hypothetical protein IDJ75_15340 [Mucilaginibacter rigui]|uniref:Uncharacterized protein n=1 Tax=Mucilaginibacter rigui TaxID=534635 RepID=A0ABR7X7X1_9SPHI|nr:hypothetical protein [Mucilaginibacter rigui]
MQKENVNLNRFNPSQRLNQRYRFADPNMNLFFIGALGWGRQEACLQVKHFMLPIKLRMET